MRSGLSTSQSVPWGPVIRLTDRCRVQPYLFGFRTMEPRLENQMFWARALEDKTEFRTADGTWKTLQKFTVPRIRLLGSSAHNLGMQWLRLREQEKPDFGDLARRVGNLTPWKVVPRSGEVPAREFFELLSRRRFPVVESLRPLRAVFCGYEPDFWHEAVGHLTLLTDSSYSDLYEWCGSLVSGLYVSGENQKAAALEKILWVLLEYGFIKEGGALKSFGAALTGSFMGLERFRRNYLFHDLFDCEKTLRSGLHDEGHAPRRTWTGKFRFFYVPSIDFAKEEILRWLEKPSGLPPR